MALRIGMLNKMENGRPAREPILNTPSLVAWMIGALGAVFLLQSLLPAEDSWSLVESFGIVPARYAGEAVPSLLPGVWGRLVPLLSYSLLHGGPTHIILNAAWLLAIGTPVAQRLGSLRFLLFCLVSTVAAALFYIAVKWGSTAPMIGASGAISGLFGGLARFMFGRRQDGRSMAFSDRRVLAFAAVWLALNLVAGLSGIGTQNGAAAIAWEAHMGGFIAGLALFPLFDPKPEPG
jgi:membrane associated rhomboid family serine protease